MRKTTLTTEESNHLSYLDNYEEINKYKYGDTEINKKTKKKKEIILSRGVRWFLFILFIFLQILMNFDHGSIPAATEEIRNDLNIDDNILGIFGSLVFLGNLIGSLISYTLINYFNRKFLLIVSLILNGACLWTFTLTTIFWLLFANRIVVGIFQAYVSIYLPVWCDQFGIRKKKSIMISFIQVGTPLGVVFGYFVTSLIKDKVGWRYSFIIQAVLVGVTVMILAFIPSIYFSSTLSLRKFSNENGINCETKSDELSIYKDNAVTDSRRPSRDEFENRNSFPKSFAFLSNLKIILKQKIYLFSVFSLSSLFFVITGVQYWGSDYMLKALNVKDNNLRLLSFSIVCITSPTLGVILGGWTSSLVGGYEAKHSILLCLIYALCAGVFSIPVPLVNSLLSFTIFLWLVLFFGGAIMPAMTGIIISTLPEELRGSANSITSVFSNLFGYLPSPFVYGIINEQFKEINNRIAFGFIMYYSFFGVIFLALACIFRYRYFNSLNKDNQTIIASQNLLENGKKNSTVSLKPRGSLLSENIAKVFGNYVISDNENILRMNEELNEGIDSSKQINYEIQIKYQLKSNSLSDFGVNRTKDFEVQEHYPEPANIEINQINGPELKNNFAINTPQFTLLHNGDDLEFFNKGINNNNELEGSKLSNDESLFGLKEGYSSNYSNEETSNNLAPNLEQTEAKSSPKNTNNEQKEL